MSNYYFNNVKYDGDIGRYRDQNVKKVLFRGNTIWNFDYPWTNLLAFVVPNTINEIVVYTKNSKTPDIVTKQVNVASQTPVYYTQELPKLTLTTKAKKMYVNANATSMFAGMENLERLDLNRFSFNKTTVMTSTFEGDVNLHMKPVNAPIATTMINTYRNCTNMTGNPMVSQKATSTLGAFADCPNISGSPVVSPVATVSTEMYRNCVGLTGNPVIGAVTTTVTNMYNGCVGLTGEPVIGAKVTAMGGVYENCIGLTGNPVVVATATAIENAYRNCKNVTGIPQSPAKVTNMAFAYADSGVSGSPVCGAVVVNFAGAYSNCKNITGTPVIGANVTNAQYAYADSGVSGQPVSTAKLGLAGLAHTYENCYNLTGIPRGVTNIKNFAYAYANCYNMVGNPTQNLLIVNSNYTLVVNMSHAMYDCRNLQGIVRSGGGAAVKDVSYIYYNCSKITGAGGIGGANCTNAAYAYYNCSNLTTVGACGASVTNMSHTFYNCWRATGTVSCGAKVTDFSYAFYNCGSLTTAVKLGAAVTNGAFAYYGCSKITGAFPNVAKLTNITGMFYGCSTLSGGTTTINPEVDNLCGSFFACKNVTINLPSLENIVNLRQAFMGTNITLLLQNFVLNPAINSLSQSFYGCSMNNVIIMEIPSTIEKLDYAFGECKNLRFGQYFEIPYSITDLTYSFTNCIGLYNVVSPFFLYGKSSLSHAFSGTIINSRILLDITTVTNMSNAFTSSNCSGLTVAGYFTNPVNMAYAFANSQVAESIHTFENVTNMYEAYYNAKNLKGTIGSLDNTLCNNFVRAFSGCNQITGPVVLPNTGSLVVNYAECFKDSILLDIYNIHIYGKNGSNYYKAFENIFYSFTSLYFEEGTNFYELQKNNCLYNIVSTELNDYSYQSSFTPPQFITMFAPNILNIDVYLPHELLSLNNFGAGVFTNDGLDLVYTENFYTKETYYTNYLPSDSNRKQTLFLRVFPNYTKKE